MRFSCYQVYTSAIGKRVKEYMKETDYLAWLQRQQLQENTIKVQMYRSGRVEQCCGDLDQHYTSDRMTALIQKLTYSADDERRNRPNPTSIPIDGNIRNNLA